MPEGVGYGSKTKTKTKTKRKRQTKLTKNSKPLTPKEIEKEFHGKYKVENPKAKTKIKALSKDKARRDRVNTETQQNLDRKHHFNVGGDSKRAVDFRRNEGRIAVKKSDRTAAELKKEKEIRRRKRISNSGN